MGKQWIIAARYYGAFLSAPSDSRALMLLNIFTLLWDDMSNTAPRIIYIAFVAWNDMRVEMKDRLACNFPNVYSDIETTRRMQRRNKSPRLFNCLCNFDALLWGRVKPAGDVSSGND